VLRISLTDYRAVNCVSRLVKPASRPACRSAGRWNTPGGSRPTRPRGRRSATTAPRTRSCSTRSKASPSRAPQPL